MAGYTPAMLAKVGGIKLGKIIDLTGLRFSRLTVVKRAENTKYGSTQWICRCDCGNEIKVDSQNLRSGKTKSCGCLQRERAEDCNIKHGMFGTKLYRA